MGILVVCLEENKYKRNLFHIDEHSSVTWKYLANGLFRATFFFNFESVFKYVISALFFVILIGTSDER